MIWPPLLLLSAIVSATWLAYGMNPSVAAPLGGLALITLTRRLQWLLILLTVLPCLILIGRVAMTRARAWWLIGLSFVVALLFVRFSPEASRPVRVIDAALLPVLDEAPADSEDEFVVGLELQGNAYAFPYRALYRTPIVQLTDFDRRVLLIYSPNANSAIALDVTHEVKAEDIEYVASPDNSTLAYNRKFGQFIVGITGLTDEGKTPVGVRHVLPTDRVPWRIWKKWHPKSKVLLTEPADSDVPGVPLMARYPIKIGDDSVPLEQPIALIHTEPPIALLDVRSIDAVKLAILQSPAIVLWRVDGKLVAFSRTLGGEALLFAAKKDLKGLWQIVDGKTHSFWSRDGVCTQGLLKGRHLDPVRIEPDVYWGVSKTWWPGLRVVHADVGG